MTIILINEDNKLFVYGPNYYGQLGLGHENPVDEFTEIPNVTVISASCGSEHIAYIDENKRLFVCGDNDHGQLGLGHKDEINTFTEIPNFKAVQVACTFDSTLVLTEDGELFISGQINSKFTILNTTSFRKMSILGVSSISCGEFNYMLITDDERVIIIDPESECIINEIPNFNAVFAASGLEHSVFINNNNDLFVYGDNKFSAFDFWCGSYSKEPIKIDGYKVISASCCRFSTIFITEDHIVIVCGGNEVGQLGLGCDDITIYEFTEIPNFRAVYVNCVGNSTFFVTEDHKVFACGNNKYGQLGLGHQNEVYTPTEIPNFTHKLIGNRRFKNTKSARNIR
jgi:E3 ubiquitin-protein ligase HERC4